MHPETLLILSYILLLLATCILPSLSDAKNYYYRYTDCAPTNYTCGTVSFTVAYPFQFGTDRPDYCRYPGYYLTCTDDGTLLINIDDGMKPFQVKSLDYGNHLLTLVDPNFTTMACPLPNYNFTINTTIFDYNDRSAMMTIYNCSSQQTSVSAGVYPLPCLEDMSRQYYYFRLNKESVFGDCVMVSQVLVQIAAVNQLFPGVLTFEDVMDEGFMLRWTAGKVWCNGCVGSGGYCGYNTIAQNEQTCYCPDGTTIGNCSTGNVKRSKMSTRKELAPMLAATASTPTDRGKGVVS